MNVRIDTPGGNPEEVTIAINPTNPDNIIAGANLRYVFSSFDGGRTWKQSLLPSNTYGDPCVIFDADGRAYYAHLTVGWDAITVRTSDDGGLTWSSGTKLYGPNSGSAKPGSLFNSSLQDKEWMIADMTNSKYRGNIYASWTDFTKYGSMDPKDSSVIVFARSTDRGVSFEPFVRVSDKAGNAIDSDETMEGAVPAVGPEGEIYIAWSGPDGIYFDRSFDGGITWGEDRVISTMPGGWEFDISGLNRANGLPITVADISNSPYRGTVYVNWIDHRNSDADVFIIKSTDKGNSWSPVIRVNDDPVSNGKDQFFTWATVDPKTGELLVIYYDRRKYSSDSTDVYLARSGDGGATFTNELISAAAFYPNALVFMGDYNCIAAYDGRIRPIWTRLHNSALSIHTALIDPVTGIDEETDITPGQSSLYQNYPNPVSSSTKAETVISFSLAQSGYVHLTVHDIMGRTVATLAEGWMKSGGHSFPVNIRETSPGTYFYRLVESSSTGNERSSIHTRFFTVLK